MTHQDIIFLALPAEMPLHEGLSVFAFGFSGVFVALAVVGLGIKLTAVIVRKLEANSDDTEGQSERS